MGISENRSRQRRFSLTGIWIPLGIVLLCACAAVSVAIIGSLIEAEEEADDSGRTIVYGLTLKPSGIDPHINRSAELGIPLYSVYDTLIYRHPQTFEFVGGLANSWNVSSDGLVYTFNLKENVTFHDDTPFNADAVGVTFDRVFDESDSNSLSQKSRFMFGNAFAGYAILDELTFQIRLIEPYPALLDALSQPYWGIASPTAIANYSRSTYQLHQVGTGPYRFVKYTPDKEIILERNEDYQWGPVFYAELNENVSIDRIIFRFFENPETRRLALEAGDVDIIGELPPSDAQILLGDNEYEIRAQGIPGQPQQFIFNTQLAPTDDANVRRALISATNRATIVDTVFRTDFSPVAFGPVSSNMPYYNEAVQQFYDYDPQEARSLLAAANYTDSDEDGILDRNGDPLEIKIVIAGWSSFPDVAALIQSQWQEVGISVSIVQVPSFSALIEAAESGEYHLLALNDFGTDPVLLNSYYFSNGFNNFTGYSDEELDGWLIQASTAVEDQARSDLYALAQVRIMEQALILPIRDYSSVVGWDNNVDGIIFAPQGWWPLLNNVQFNEADE